MKTCRRFSLLPLFLVVALLASAQDVTPPPELPDSPGTTAKEQKNEQKTTEPAQTPAPSNTRAVQKPVGTAAAEKPETVGVAGSNASGAAVAPAKPKRTRALLIKIGAIVGAGVAVGTVAALSSGSPSRPPGSH